ncbi:MAG: hypothetical protein R2726_00515 [Acidimicrobiales bacterium]
MGEIVEDVVEAAELMAMALRSSKYQADFSATSLWEVDRFFDEQSRNGAPVRGGLLDVQLGMRVFAMGAYVGEVLRRNLGGTWHGDDADEHAEMNVELLLSDTTVCWPVQQVMKRFVLGPSEGLADYGRHLGLDVGRRPRRRRLGRRRAGTR